MFEFDSALENSDSQTGWELLSALLSSVIARAQRMLVVRRREAEKRGTGNMVVEEKKVIMVSPRGNHA